MKKNVLLVENKAISFVLKTTLEKKYTVTSVENSFLAMQTLLSDKHFDLLILSMDDKESENYEFLQHVSTSSMLNNIPVVLLSNSTDDSFKLSCEEMGVVKFMEKPFDPVVLQEVVHNLTSAGENGQIIQKKRTIFNLNIFNF